MHSARMMDKEFILPSIFLIGALEIIFAIILQIGNAQGGNWTINDAWIPFLTGIYTIVFASAIMFKRRATNRSAKTNETLFMTRTAEQSDALSNLSDRFLYWCSLFGPMLLIMGLGGLLITDPLSMVNVNNAIPFVVLGSGITVVGVISYFTTAFDKKKG